MNASFIRLVVIAAVVSAVVITSNASAGRLPRPLGLGHQLLAPGVHVLDLVAREQPSGAGPKHLPRIAITLPRGWYNYDGWGMNDGGTLIVSFWDVANVYATGCKWWSEPMVTPGRTVGDLARALATRPLRHATRPRKVVLAGFHGKYLRWSVPEKIDFRRCGQGYFESWTAKGWSSDRYQQGPGQVDRLWILDVNGQRLVIDAAYMPEATGRQRAELDRIVHSIRFLRTGARALSAVTEAARRAGPLVRNGPWIAYSTAPACAASYGCRTGKRGSGSDVFMTHAGGSPVLVAARGPERAWNVCPAFSPNGRLLAFATEAQTGSAIVVVHVGRAGPLDAGRLALKAPAGQASCPRWSSDSSRLAYLHRGKVVVLGLDGKLRRRSNGDPTIDDFERSTKAIASPTGELIATERRDSTIVVSRPDGSEERIIPSRLTNGPDPGESSYGIAGWSPDGRKILLMYDVGGFEMRAVSVDPPFAAETVVADGPFFGARLWIGLGDVSWQPLP